MRMLPGSPTQSWFQVQRNASFPSSEITREYVQPPLTYRAKVVKYRFPPSPASPPQMGPAAS